MHTGIKHHFYNVSFAPQYSVKSDNKDYFKLPFAEMYKSKDFCSYMLLYPKTIGASKCGDKVKYNPCLAKELLHHNKRKIILDEDFVKLITSPLHYTPSIKGVPKFPIVPVRFEIAKNEFFCTLLSNKIADAFHTGPLPLLPKNPYTLYGRSVNDLCIVHKEHYMQGGLITWQDEDKGEDDDDVEMLDGESWCDTKGGTIELKMKYTATQQTLKEMMSLAGDLTARSLQMGSLVRHVIVYGINATYSSGATLLKLSIDFPQMKICSVCSDDRVRMHIALNWLLQSISEPNVE